MNRVWHFFVYTSLVVCLYREQLHLLISFTKPHVTRPQPSLWIYVTVSVVLSALTLVSYCYQQTKNLFLPSPLTLLFPPLWRFFHQASIWLLGSFPFKFYSPTVPLTTLSKLHLAPSGQLPLSCFICFPNTCWHLSYRCLLSVSHSGRQKEH